MNINNSRARLLKDLGLLQYGPINQSRCQRSRNIDTGSKVEVFKSQGPNMDLK